MEALVLLVVWFGGFAALGRWVAMNKRRRGAEGLTLGLLFGPLGVIVEALLPTNPERDDEPLASDFPANANRGVRVR